MPLRSIAALLPSGPARRPVMLLALGTFALGTDAFVISGVLQVSPLPDSHVEAIRASAILLGLRQLSLWLSPERAYPLSRPLVQLRIAELSNLLTDEPA